MTTVPALLPLEGRIVGVTADRRADEQVELLERQGAAVLHGPTMHTRPLADTDELLDVTRRVVSRPPHFVLATTGIGMRSWIAAAEAVGLDADLFTVLNGARMLARGPKVAGALKQIGLPLWRQEPSERLSEMVRMLTEDVGVDGSRIVLQESGNPVPWAVDALTEAGADVTTVPVYRWTMPTDPAPARQLIDAIVGGRLDAVTFTSPPALQNLLAIAGDEGGAGATDHVRRALNRVVVAAVGPVTAEVLADAGVRSCVAPERGRLGLMVRVLADRLAANEPMLAVAGADVVIQGSVVTRGPVRIELTPRERAVLHTLVDHRGGVVPRNVLLREVWGGEPVGAKLVDTTVSRLRRRLSPAGISIQTVVRRGYRIDADFAPVSPGDAPTASPH